MQRVACAATDHLKDSAVALIEEAAGRPLMVSYQSDGTAIVCRHQIRSTIEGVTGALRHTRTVDGLL